MDTEKLEREIPASFGDAFSPYFLGDPEVVNGLVGSYCAATEELIVKVWSKRVSPDEFMIKGESLTREYADIFSGRHPGFSFVQGYNDSTLPNKLKADFGDYWKNHRSDWDDDPVCCLFAWLTAMIAEKMKIANGDDMLLGVMLKPSVQYVVKVFLGIEERVTP